MKIIHVITAFGIGGAEKLLLNVINKQVNEHEVHLIYLKPIDDLILLIDKRITVNQIALSLRTINRLKKYYRKVNPDIIHTHLGHADIMGIWSARKLETKIFCTMHNIYFQKNFLDTIYFKIYRFLFKKTSSKSYVISISKSVENHVLKKLKVQQKRSFVLYNSIPNKELKFNNNKELIKLLFIGRLERQKSLDTLLKAVKHLKENKPQIKFELTIVGEGKLEGEIKQLTTNLQINSCVKFMGKQQDVNSFYEQADIFILPSVWEGFGIVILEAFRAKVAVIASNIEGPAELINHNVNGLLFEPKNDLQLAQHITILIKDKDLRSKLAQNGYNTFTEKYQIETYVEKLNELYLNA